MNTSIPESTHKKPRCTVVGRHSHNRCPNEAVDYNAETAHCAKHLLAATTQYLRTAITAVAERGGPVTLASVLPPETIELLRAKGLLGRKR